MIEDIKKQIQEHNQTLASFTTELLESIETAGQKSISTLNKGGKILICGNGGSAADSQHFSAELVCRYLKDRQALAAISLTNNGSNITAIGNDFDFDQVFSRQVEALGNPGDILFAISTSGNSKNILEAIKSANKRGLTVIGLTGKNQGEMDKLCDILIKAPSKNTPRIQECHSLIIHILCQLIEEAYTSERSHQSTKSTQTIPHETSSNIS